MKKKMANYKQLTLSSDSYTFKHIYSTIFWEIGIFMSPLPSPRSSLSFSVTRHFYSSTYYLFLQTIYSTMFLLPLIPTDPYQILIL